MSGTRFPATELGDAVEKTVAAGLVAQARALALARQQDAGTFVADEVLRERLTDAQETFRANSDHYLNDLLPDVVGTVSGAHGASDLVSALAATSTPESLRELLDAVREQMSGYHQDARMSADRLTAAAERARGKRADLEALLKRVREAEDEDGAIERIQEEIEVTKKAIDAGLDDVVAQSKAVGAGVKDFLTDKLRLVTGVVTSFGDDDRKPRPDTDSRDRSRLDTERRITDKARDNVRTDRSSRDRRDADRSSTDKPGADRRDGDRPDGDRPGADKPRADRAGAVRGVLGGVTGRSGSAGGRGRSFAVEGIDIDRSKDTSVDDTSAAAGGLGQAVTRFKAANERLAELYQELYRQTKAVAVATVIADQADAYVRSLDTAARHATGLAATWTRLVEWFATAQSVDPADWAPLTARLAAVRAALGGDRGAIADVSHLTSVRP